MTEITDKSPATLERATLGGGCFWCLEAVYQQIQGVKSVVSGYAGGARPNPSYESVCTGVTGHAEIVDVEFDPQAISFRDLLEIFFVIHDPTTLNYQGNDHGTQYRSVIFTHSEEQNQVAHEVVKELEDAKIYSDAAETLMLKNILNHTAPQNQKLKLFKSNTIQIKKQNNR